MTRCVIGTRRVMLASRVRPAAEVEAVVALGTLKRDDDEL